MKHSLQERIEVALDSLYLDPNNYRFIDSPDYEEVAEEAILSERIQRRTQRFLLGAKQKSVQDLIKSFKANGYLEVDQIQVEPLGEDKYRVLEGNRRIATLKYLAKLYEEGHSIGKLEPELFNNMPVTLVQQKREGEHEMVMALKHISGNKKWPTLNQAQLLQDLIEKYGWTEEQVTESVGITKHKLRRDLRTLALIELYKDSDFGDQFETGMYTIFREIISSTSIKHWLEWDDSKRKAQNAERTERLFSWLSEIEEEKTVKSEDEEWETVTYIKSRIITQSPQVSKLAKIIKDEAALEHMEQERSITEAYSVSSLVANDRYKSTLSIIEQQVETAKLLSRHADEDDRQKILQIKKDVESMLVSISGLEQLQFHEAMGEILYNVRTEQLQSLRLHQYKRFKDGLELGPFNRVNIFAGNNNSGKTSILEAIYMLCQLNHFESLYRIYKQRGKFSDGVPSDWLAQVLPSAFILEGDFDGKAVRFSLQKQQEADSQLDKSNYATSLFLEAQHQGQTYGNKIRLNKGKGNYAAYYERLYKLCHTVFSNPFVLQDREALERYYDLAVDRGSKAEIVAFLREHIDANIQSIDKSGTGHRFRFMVDYAGSERPIDLTEFGDGIQRVFHISLMVVAAEKGVICIDEIENAIHHSLLVEFTDFIQRLAHKYHVQVFASTHSAECIRAFFENDYKNEEITGFRLVERDGCIESQKAIGKAFQIQLEEFSLDLRG